MQFALELLTKGNQEPVSFRRHLLRRFGVERVQKRLLSTQKSFWHLFNTQASIKSTRPLKGSGNPRGSKEFQLISIADDS